MSKTAYVFPGQGAQFVGMGKELYESHPLAKDLFEKANEILGFRITDIMFDGTDEELKQTKVTQPAVFLHSVIRALCLGDEFQPDMVAGHSLGEFSALVAAGALSFEDGLRLVSKRALAMQAACELQPSTMAAVLGLPDERVTEIVASIQDEVVVAANFNCPGQLVISGTVAGVDKACELLKEAGAKRALKLNVGGAFHSPLMEPASNCSALSRAPSPTSPAAPSIRMSPPARSTAPTGLKRTSSPSSRPPYAGRRVCVPWSPTALRPSSRSGLVPSCRGSSRRSPQRSLPRDASSLTRL